MFGFPDQQQDSDCDQNCRAQASLESIHIIKEETARTIGALKDADIRGTAAVGQAENMELHVVPGGMETACDPEIAVPFDQQAQEDAEQEHIKAKYRVKAIMEHIQFVVEYEEGAAHECDRVPTVFPSQNSRHIPAQQNFFGGALDEHKEDQGKD